MALTFIQFLTFIGLCYSISVEETSYFNTTGATEQNTGVVGFVTVVEDPDNVDNWLITSNGVPDHHTPVYPNMDNPNEIQVQSFSFSLPKNPVIADEASCLPPGPIGVAKNGVAIFNPWDDDGENAVEGEGAEIFDACDGHPTPQGTYHYHRQPSGCLFEIEDGVPSTIIGVAMDGFAIYGPVDENGVTLTSDDLDECHGRYNSDGTYQYHTTSDYPYILGCFKATPYNTNGGGFKCYFAEDMEDPDTVTDPMVATTSRADSRIGGVFSLLIVLFCFAISSVFTV